MKKSTDMGNIQDRPGEEPVALAYPTLDRLALAWSIGIGIGYVFLISFICWIGTGVFSSMVHIVPATTHSSWPN